MPGRSRLCPVGHGAQRIAERRLAREPIHAVRRARPNGLLEKDVTLALARGVAERMGTSLCLTRSNPR